jgi:hypothetical protein
MQLAFGAAARQLAVVDGGDAGRVIAAVFEALERIDQMARDRRSPEYSDDPAHPSGWPLFCVVALTGAGKLMEIKMHFVV